jgi:carboxyl-terminal processing protease
MVLGLIGLVGSACSRSDASTTDGDSQGEQPAAATTDSREPAQQELPDLDKRSFPLLIWAAHTVEGEYFDKSRLDPVGQLDSALSDLGLHTPAFFAEFNADRTKVTVRVASSSQEFATGDLDSLIDAADRLEQILEFAQSVLDLDEEPLHELEYAAINGLFAPLDPHTILLTPEEHADLGVRTKGEFGGIGAEIRAERRRIVIVRVLPGMPADKAGIKAGDVVTRISGQSTVNMSAQEAQQLLRGPVGTQVPVIVRRGKTTITKDVERATIHIDSVTSALLPGAIAYLRISNFQENTADQVRQALTLMGSEGGPLKGVVIDLRGNAGGLLVQATAVVDQLVPRGELVIVRSALGREVDPATESTILPPEASVVALIDEESASAAEIVSGGLKALGRGLVLGRSSFGKGTVQVVRPASPYGRELALKLTIAEYLVAGDRKIQTRGVVPDLELHPVELTRIPGVVRYYDLERFERQRERSRVAHLPSAKHELAGMDMPQAEASLRYLWTDDVPGDVKVPEEMKDPEIRIAADIAASVAGETDAEARRGQMQTAATRIGLQEEGRIVEALRKTKVDWSKAPGIASSPSVETKAEILEEGPIDAGKMFTLHVEVTNTGDEVVHRAHAITDCVHDELDGIELMLGAIEPGDTAVRDVQLHVMPWHSDFTDVLRIDTHVGEPDDEPDASAQVLFAVHGAPRPELSYDVWVVDSPSWAEDSPSRPPAAEYEDAEAFSVHGNGDGVVQPGENVLVAFAAHNRGPGTSPQVRALLRNLSGRQGLLEEGAVDLGEIEPGGTKTGAFGLAVRKDADPALPIELELMIGDIALRTVAEDELRLRVLSDTGTYAEDETGYEIQKEAIRLYAGAHASAPIVGEVPVGTQLLSVGQIGNWRVFEMGDNGRRVFAPADLEALAKAETVHASQFDKVQTRREVLPPSIEVDDFARRTSAAQVSISGTIQHPERVRDVVVLVRPPGTGTQDRKVHFAAGQPGATELKFETAVPLEKGGNRVTILARDGTKVQQRRDLWVYRE